MKVWMLAAIALFAVVCASTEPAAAPQQNAPTYEDARSRATDAEIRDARRAYRSVCQQNEPDGYCECMTGGMAQALAPTELAIATAQLRGQAVNASSEVRTHVEAMRTEVDRGCAQFRG